MHTRDETRRERERENTFVCSILPSSSAWSGRSGEEPSSARPWAAGIAATLKKTLRFSSHFLSIPFPCLLYLSLSLSPQSIYISIYISLSPVRCAPFVTPWIWTQRCHVTIPRLCCSCPILLSFFSPNSKVTVWKDCVTTDAVLEKTLFVRWVRVCVRCYFNPPPPTPPPTPPPPVLSLYLSPAHNSLSLRLSLCTTYSTQPSLPLSPDVHQSIPPALTEPNLNLKPSLIMHPNSSSSVCVSVCACVCLSLSLYSLSRLSSNLWFVCLFVAESVYEIRYQSCFLRIW